jgi:hypothetical protein
VLCRYERLFWEGLVVLSWTLKYTGSLVEDSEAAECTVFDKVPRTVAVITRSVRSEACPKGAAAVRRDEILEE